MSSLPLDINFLAPMEVPHGQVVIPAEATSIILDVPFGATSSSGFRPRACLKKITTVCTVAGAAGNFRLGGATSGDLLLAVGASTAGTRVEWEFPVPLQGQGAFYITVGAGMGTWAFIANGFVM